MTKPALLTGITPWLASLALAATASNAAANVVAYGGDTQAPREPAPRRLEGRFGMLLGGSEVGDADGFSLGFATGLGYRIGDITLRGLIDYYRVGDGGDDAMQRRGHATRVGGAIRYSLLSTHDENRARGGVGLDVWGELGIGIEHVAWREGGVLDRPSGEFAVGFELDGRGERRNSRRRHGGYYLAFRTHAGQGPEMNVPAVCGGPCTRATKPSRLDTSMFFEFGLHVGR
ncbi:MAG: hypothetical protein SFX73_22275 [Kofleriaceae bacterium]|nr:hypothetical protein [Kofleriaceae bacterium]